MKYGKADANYAIATKWVQLQHEKKPVSNLTSMQSVDCEQTFRKVIEIFIPQECAMSWPVSNKYDYQIYKGREMHRH